MYSPAFTTLFLVTTLACCASALASVPAPLLAPALDCRAAPAGSIDELVCKDPDLAEQHRKMSELLGEAQAKTAADKEPPQLKASQRRWLRSRNDCWKSRERRQCVANSYRLRIADLQARYQLLEGSGPFRYACDGQGARTIVVTFFPTEPATLLAERGDRRSLMVIQPSASGARYQSRNESFWEHQGEASVVWGRGSAPRRCKRVP